MIESVYFSVLVCIFRPIIQNLDLQKNLATILRQT